MTDTPSFDEFYAAFPRKVGKIAARTAYRCALKDIDGEALVKAAEAQAAIWHALTGYQNKKGQARLDALKFCPHPRTWLTQGRWEDEVIQEYLSKPERVVLPIHMDAESPFAGRLQWLREQVGDTTYQTWFMNMTVEQEGEIWIFTFPTRFLHDWVKKAHSAMLERAFGSLCRFRIAVPSEFPPEGGE